MKTNLMVEGADGSGKSTIAKKLAEKLNLTVYHAGGPIETVVELHERINNQLTQNYRIVDRCSVFSEPVYGMCLRGKSLLDARNFDHYVKKMVKDGWTVVWCMGDGDIKPGKEWKSEEHMQGVRENQRNIRRSYNIVMDRALRLGLQIITWDWTDYTLKELKIAEDWLEWQVRGCVE
jgi:Cdc6-like AAA superfamily ATPase